MSGPLIGPQAIRKIIKRRTAEVLGTPILPHAFRTSAATTFVLEYPEHVIEASALLAHTDFSTTEKHYLAGRRQLAVRVTHQALRRIRRNATANEMKPDSRDCCVDDEPGSDAAYEAVFRATDDREEKAERG